MWLTLMRSIAARAKSRYQKINRIGGERLPAGL